MKKRAIYAGTFDPVTNGHIDLIKRALKIFDEVIIAVADNPSKNPLFSLEERVKLIKESLKIKKRILVESFHGLLVNYADKINVNVVIRGIRALSDFEYEFQMALSNRKLNPKIETIFLMPHESYAYLNSRLIKEIVSLGGEVRSFVPPCVARALKKKLTH